jgi:hypothetical protein
MASRLTSIQVGGATLIALAAGTVGYFVGNVTITQTLTVQTLTATGTVTAQTISGATLKLGGGSTTITGSTANGWALGTSGTLTGATLSGSTVRGGGGNVTLNLASGVVSKTALSGATLAATPKTGSAALKLYSGASTKGAHICIYDTDNGGWTSIDALNGTVGAHIASATECP